MNVRTRRSRLRVAVGASALLTTVALVGLAGPAHAADGADLQLVVSDKKIAAGSLGKIFTVAVKNTSDVDASAFDVEFDLSGLNDKVKVDPLTDITGCELAGAKITCSFTDLALAKDLAIKIPFGLDQTAGAIGDAGSFKVSVLSESDPNKANNEATVGVEIPGSGVDLGVFAFDVYALDASGAFTDEPVAPGETSIVAAGVANQGDKIADGLKVSVTLPNYVTFTEVEDGCTYTSDNRTVTCDYKGLVLAPGKVDLTQPFGVGAFFPVKVASNAPGPVNLTGGTFSAAALAETDPADASSLAKLSSSKLPNNFKALTAADVKDIDLSDNTDDFTVFVGAPASGGGGGGGLPVTGVQAGLMGGIGGAALITGAVLFMVARRRRVVLVTPGDEKSTV
jgi:hypothetical protein